LSTNDSDSSHHQLSDTFVPSETMIALGWKQPTAPAEPATMGRVVRHDRAGWTIATHHGDLLADLRGRLRSTMSALERPSVGDWVTVAARPAEQRATIETVLPRGSALIRQNAGNTTEAQVVAANVDIVFVTVPGDSPPNPRRVERELITVWESGAQPVIVATKADLGGDTSWIEGVAMGAPVVSVDAFSTESLAALDLWLISGNTIVLFGPSGAGKSTLANGLLGQAHLETGDVRSSDHRGRHTTTRRELVRLPGGAMLIDTPGIRELALWDAAEGVGTVFEDVEEITSSCRFNDCTHRGEPGCAVQAALDDGTLDADRLKSWDKLQREAAHQARRLDHRLQAEEKQKWAQRSKEARARTRP
jgi:ribosome biogenesis GTPase / thiamine phosphate phosphatase